MPDRHSRPARRIHGILPWIALAYALGPAAAAPPVIVLHPVDQRTASGDITRFATAGDPRIPTTFQWYKNGFAIPGANTPNLVVRNTRPADQADYNVVLRNADGEAHSRPASLRVHYLQQAPGVTDTSFLAPLFSAGSQLSSVAVTPDRKILAGGSFTVTGNSASNLVRLLPDGTLDPQFAPHSSPPDDQVRAIHIDDAGRALVVGDFTSIAGTPCSRIARLLPGGGLDPSFHHELGADNDILAAAVLPSGKIVIAGKFQRVLTSSGWVDRPYLTRLLPDGEPDLTFNQETLTGGPVLTLDIDGLGRILAGGSFTRAGGIAYPRVARLNEDGTTDTSFFRGSGPNLQVRSLSVTPDGHILIGGDFRIVHGVQRERFARLSPDGSLDTSFNVPCDLPVRHITDHPAGGHIVAGRFTEIGNQAFRRIAHLTPEGVLDTTFETFAIDEEVRFTTVTPDGKLLAAGDFTRPHSHLVQLHLTHPPASTPTILTTLPPAISVKEGDSKIISVVAASTPVPRFTWFRNGVPIQGFYSNELLISDATLESSGQYTVEIKNDEGAVTSPAVSLETSQNLPGSTSTVIVAANGTYIVTPGETMLATVNVDASFPVASVRAEVTLTHPQTNQLDIDLISPSGTIVELFDGDDKSGRDLAGTIFDDSAPVSISSVSQAQPPYIGTFRPEEPLSEFVGEISEGGWTLRVRDDRVTGPEGPLQSFRLHLERPVSDIEFSNYAEAFYIPDDPSLDTNGDGYSNFTAFALTASPSAFLSPLQLSAPGVISHSRWIGTEGVSYVYETSTDLSGWIPVSPTRSYSIIMPDNRSKVIQTFSPPPQYLRLRLVAPQG